MTFEEFLQWVKQHPHMRISFESYLPTGAIMIRTQKENHYKDVMIFLDVLKSSDDIVKKAMHEELLNDLTI
jgi:hypothetical protein